MNDDRLLCAWCGKPLSAVEGTFRESLRRGRHFGWHPWCVENDPESHGDFDDLLGIIESRGTGRVGVIE